MTRKSGKQSGKHSVRYTEQLLLDLISSAYLRRSNQQPQNAEAKFYHWDIGPHRTQAMPN